MPSTDQLPDRIADMFHGRTVFITGGSGFLGKILVEKLLRRCVGVKTIYLLIRDKKGKSPHERMSDIFDNMLFDLLKEQQPNAIKKCKPICGDVTQNDLGISPEDRKILQNEVDFIYHSAASTRFDSTVKVAAKMNTRGTKYMLDLAHECKKLKVFVHVSTAYAYPHEKILYEKTYPPPADPSEVLATIDFDREDDSDEPFHLGLLGDCPNTYTFTKALAEGLVVEEMNRLPAIIVRPSIVCPTWREPLSGWCNNLQGPMGLFVGAGKGIIRSMYMQGDSYADFIPADIVINGMILSTWYLLNCDKNQRIFNITASSEYNLSWEELIEAGKDVIRNHIPFNGVVWYPDGSIKKSKLIHNICFYLFQIIPAIFIDALLMVLGYKPISLYQIQRRIQKGGEMFEYYTTKAWNFDNKELRKITKSLNEKEKKIYKLDGEGLEIKDYLKGCIMGVRRNNLKETDDMLPAARRNMKIMWVLDVFCKSMFVMAILYYTYRWILQPLFKI
ncbi:NAD binding 4, Sterile and/or Epimerase domain containing protein [Asbolus verrucosus]|uniref:Fatty acyl-CoA reductase n=1 Tax=Asbolus verrucosus TaxID=1661398 RepID=A0A482W9U2_ASBVE|nr:NAD binding 4, Sterile and/or Epimerase domain containing protein [Asbolus verrucosus]